MGEYGWLMTTANFALSLSLLGVAYGLHNSLVPSRALTLRLRFLTVWIVGVFPAGLFVTDLRTDPKTAVGLVHDVSALLAFISMPVAAVLIGRAFRADPAWRYRQHWLQPTDLRRGHRPLAHLCSITVGVSRPGASRHALTCDACTIAGDRGPGAGNISCSLTVERSELNLRESRFDNDRGYAAR